MAEIKLTSSAPAGTAAVGARVIVSTPAKRVREGTFMLPQPVPATPKK